MKYLILTAAVMIASPCLAYQDARPPMCLPVVTDHKVSTAQLNAQIKAHKRLMDAIQKVEGCDAKYKKGDRTGCMAITSPMFNTLRTNWRDNREIKRAEVNADDTMSRYAVVCYWATVGAKTDRERALVFHYGHHGVGDKLKKDPDKYWEKIQKAMNGK